MINLFNLSGIQNKEMIIHPYCTQIVLDEHGITALNAYDSTY